MSDPLISIVVPTCGQRSLLLTRAIQSAAAGVAADDLEIILVPNGAGSDWRDACGGKIRGYPLVVIEHRDADRIVARAAGLQAARGKLVRFLDDDDYLIPSVAVRQYDTLLDDDTLDACSAPIELVDKDYRCYGVRTLPETTDFIAAILLPTRIPLFLAHVFRTDLAKKVGLPMDVARAEDAVFLFRLCRMQEVTWRALGEPVGAWYQHPNARTSSKRGFEIGRMIIATELFGLYRQLQNDGRLTQERRDAAAKALWECVHLGFPYNPLAWGRFGRKITREFPNTWPDLLPDIYTLGRRINPLVSELVLAPLRRASHVRKKVASAIDGNTYKRRV